MNAKKRPSRRMHSAARDRMNATGEKYTTARDKISSEDSQSAPSSSVYAWQALAGVARLPYEDFDMWMPTEVIPGEDPRTLNGLHIEKGIGKHYDVWKIYDEPHVDLETDEEVNIEADERFRRVDSGGWFDVTPTIRCSVDSIYGTGWRIQLHRYGIRSEKTTVIQSATYRESVTVPIDDGYLASALALHTVYRFLTDVQSGHYRLWKSSEAGTRALFPSAAVEGGWRSGGEIVDRGFDLAQGWRQLEIERERAVRAWVDLIGQWSHWMHNWPIREHFEDFGNFLADDRTRRPQKRFKRLRDYYMKPLSTEELTWYEWHD